MFTLSAALVAWSLVQSPAPAAASVPVFVAAASSEETYAKLARDVSPALVSIKFVMDFDGGFGGEQSEESEVHGVLIREDGIVLISSAMMFGYEGMGFEIRPRDIKVLVGDDTEGLDATVIVRDRERDLAWLQIAPKEGQKFPAVTFAGSATAELGATLYQVMKLDKYFDRAPYIVEGKVASQVRKPRNLFIASGSITVGLPVFNDQGSVVGFGVLQLPDQDEMMAMQGSMTGQLVFAHTILPTRDVATATDSALARLDEDE